MADTQSPELFLYADASGMEWQQARPGSRRKILYSDAATGKLTMLVQWDAGYRMSSSSGMLTMNTSISCLALSLMNGVSVAQAHTSSVERDRSTNARHGCTFLEIVPGRSTS
jgi:hypothetical protein